jgi:hypothetical protein
MTCDPSFPRQIGKVQRLSVDCLRDVAAVGVTAYLQRTLDYVEKYMATL